MMCNIINYFLGCNRKLDSGEKDNKLTEKQRLKVIQSKNEEKRVRNA